MIQIKRNKFLTKIISSKQISSIPTKVFDEITGVTNLEYAKEFIYDKAEGDITTEQKIVNDMRRIHTGGISNAKFYDCGPNKILIDNKEVSFKKVLESWDLTYSMLCSAVRSAALFAVDKEIYCDNYSYIDGVKNITNMYIQKNRPFEPKELCPSFTHIRKSIVTPQGYTGFGKEHSLTTSLTFEQFKPPFGSAGTSINIYTPNEKIIENLIDITNKIYLNFSLFYNDEEWYFQELSRKSIEKILSKCQEFARLTTSNPPDSIRSEKIFQTFWHQSMRGLSSGIIVLQDIFGHKKIFAIKDLVPKPKYLLQKYTGKYLSMRTSKWKEDVNNYIL